MATKDEREPIMVRVPPTLKRIIEKAAKDHGRSLSAEVALLLENTYDPRRVC